MRLRMERADNRDIIGEKWTNVLFVSVGCKGDSTIYIVYLMFICIVPCQFAILLYPGIVNSNYVKLQKSKICSCYQSLCKVCPDYLDRYIFTPRKIL